ncbi:transposase-like protein [Paraburkholderia graminis]|uniref:Transposase-like protein n=1 Tax=Paraburkholderia graminis TaxID=60548 RepID=A0ABD5CSL6_9BURK|nr:transposase-like protein [Paraburkholderia graminis]
MVSGRKTDDGRESFEPGKSVSMVARQHGVNPNQLFHWRKLYQDGSLSAVSAGEEVVPASELSDALKQIRELQRLLGKKPWRTRFFVKRWR